jgi:transposase
VLERLLALQKHVRNPREWRRLEAVWLREKLGLSAADVADALNYKLQTVHLIWHQWLQEKESLFQRPAPGGRKHAYLTLEEERQFLAPFFESAAAGGVLTVAEIKAAYERRVKRKVAASTVYRLLHRHGWRKLMPRKRHPKSDPKQQEQEKKA